MNSADAKVDAIVVDGPEGPGPLRRINYVRVSKAIEVEWGVNFDLVELRDEKNEYAGVRYLDEIRPATEDERREWEVKVSQVRQ